MSFKPTEEQQAVVTHFQRGHSVAVEAMAGSGKTSTLRLLAAAAKPQQRMLYTSFGAKNVADAKVSFPRTVSARTNHALAFPGFGAAYADTGRLDKLTPRSLATHMGWGPMSFPADIDAATGAHYVLQTLGQYWQSADPFLGLEHVCNPYVGDDELADTLLGHARSVWSQMCNPSSPMPVTHDAYLKLWALSGPKLRYDAIFLDEAQDSTPLIVDVIRNQDAQLVVVGDSQQQIYGWRGAINAMSAFPVDAVGYLTQSFRFGPAVADAANVVLKSALGADAELRGYSAIDSRLGSGDETCVVARTNMGVFRALAGALDANRTTVVVGGTSELSRLVSSVEMLLAGKPPLAPELQGFKDWGEVVEFSKTPPGRDLSVLCKLVDKHAVSGLNRMLACTPANPSVEAERGVDVVLTTAHQAKGREWARVLLTDDYAEITAADLTLTPPRGSVWTPEQSRLLYVAVTRAKEQLDLSSCSAWHSHHTLLREQHGSSPLVLRTEGGISRPASSDQAATQTAASAPTPPSVNDATPLQNDVSAVLAALASVQSQLRDIDTAVSALSLAPGGADVADLNRSMVATYTSARNLVSGWKAQVAELAPVQTTARNAAAASTALSS